MRDPATPSIPRSRRRSKKRAELGKRDVGAAYARETGTPTGAYGSKRASTDRGLLLSEDVRRYLYNLVNDTSSLRRLPRQRSNKTNRRCWHDAVLWVAAATAACPRYHLIVVTDTRYTKQNRRKNRPASTCSPGQ